jgi:ribosomal protein S18 acetylase RimI-like enzyme
MTDETGMRPVPAGCTLRADVVPADVEAVRGLVAATGFFNDEEIAIAAELVAETLARGDDAGYRYLFAERDGRLLGYACFGRVPCTLASWDLYWIAVHPDTQGTGLGRRLLRETEARVAALGGTAVYAETSGRAQYAPTRAFYERSSYETVAVLDDFYAPGDAKYVFRRQVG